MYSLDKFIRENDTDGKVKEAIVSCLMGNMTKEIALDTLANDLQKRLYDFISDSETMDIDSGSNVERAFTSAILTILKEYFCNQNPEKDIYDKMVEFIEDKQNQVEEETVVEFSIASISTGKVVPRVFKTESEAEEYRAERSDPEKWKMVGRKIIYSPWE